jgi:hypothetical protein
MAVKHEITAEEALPSGSNLVRCYCGDEIEYFPRDGSGETPRIMAHGAVTIESLVELSNLYRQSEGER